MKTKRPLKTASINHYSEQRRIRLELHKHGDKYIWVTTAGKSEISTGGKTVELAVAALRNAFEYTFQPYRWNLRIKGEYYEN